MDTSKRLECSCCGSLYTNNIDCAVCVTVGHSEDALSHSRSVKSDETIKGCFFKEQLSGEETIHRTLKFVNGEQNIAKTFGNGEYLERINKANSESPCKRKPIDN